MWHPVLCRIAIRSSDPRQLGFLSFSVVRSMRTKIAADGGVGDQPYDDLAAVSLTQGQHVSLSAVLLILSAGFSISVNAEFLVNRGFSADLAVERLSTEFLRIGVARLSACSCSLLVSAALRPPGDRQFGSTFKCHMPCTTAPQSYLTRNKYKRPLPTAVWLC